MILSDDPIIRCNRCGREYKIPKDYFDGDSSPIGEFGMGARIRHDFRYGMECNYCGNPISIVIRGYEYPVGGYEDQDSEAKGCEILHEPAVEMDYYDFDIPDYIENEIAYSIPDLIEQVNQRV